MKEERPRLIFRQTRENRYTLPLLIGGLEEGGWLANLQILLAKSPVEIKEKICASPTIIAYSFMTPYMLKVKTEIEELRKVFNGKILLIAGGPHATADPVGTLKLGFDYVFPGEAEETLPRFLKQFLTGRLPADNIIDQEDQSTIAPFFPPYSREYNFFGPIEISRGCLYKCAFCQTPRIFGSSLRHRDLRNLAYHLKRAASFGYRRCSLISSNALAYGSYNLGQPNLSSLIRLFEVCKEAGYTKINFGSFPSEVRPDWIYPEALELIKKFCHNHTIVLGAQSGSDALLEKLHRAHTAGQALEAVKLIKQAELTAHVDFIFGFPEETKEDRLQSLQLASKMIREYGAKIHAHAFLPLPGTPLFTQEPTPLDPETKATLIKWEKEKKLDGWWREQEFLAQEIIKWRDQGLISGA